MISGVDAISERRTAYTLSWDLGSRYTGLLRDIYGPAHAFLVCPRCEFALSGFSIPVMHLVDSRPGVVKLWIGFCYARARVGASRNSTKS
jgi:hypothetical protein